MELLVGVGFFLIVALRSILCPSIAPEANRIVLRPLMRKAGGNLKSPRLEWPYHGAIETSKDTGLKKP